MAHTPLGRGLLSGRYDEANPPAGGRATNPLFHPDNLRAAAPLLDALRDIARAHDVLPAQIAIALGYPPPERSRHSRGESVSQLEQNVAAADIKLSPVEDARLTSAANAFQPVWAPTVRSWREAKAEQICSKIRALR